MSSLGGIAGIRLLDYIPADNPNYQYIVVEVDPSFRASRDDLVGALQAENVLARKYFWPGCHRMRPYRDLYPHAGLLLQNTVDVARRVIVLPNGSTIEDEHIDAIAGVFRALAVG